MCFIFQELSVCVCQVEVISARLAMWVFNLGKCSYPVKYDSIHRKRSLFIPREITPSQTGTLKLDAVKITYQKVNCL